MRIALIDSSPSAKLYPVGLLKIGAMLKDKGHKCKLFYSTLPQKNEYDEIWIGTVFTFDVKKSIAIAREAKHRAKRVFVGGVSVSLMPEKFKALGVDVHIGLHEEAEKYSPDYSLLEEKPKYSITHTSRGCVRKCEFCMVPKIEGKFYRRNGWERDIHKDTKKILFYDNNFLVLSDPLLSEEVGKINEVLRTTKNKSVDFNQGLDCRFLTEEKAKTISKINIDPIRFAFDNMQEDKYIQKAITMMAERGKKNFANFCLYNFKDTPQDFYYRMREAARLSDELEINVTTFPMRYQPIMDIDGNRSYVGKHWTERKKKGFMNILSRQSFAGQVSQGIEGFEYWFTDSADKFDKLIGWNKVSEYAARKKGLLRYDRARKGVIDI